MISCQINLNGQSSLTSNWHIISGKELESSMDAPGYFSLLKESSICENKPKINVICYDEMYTEVQSFPSYLEKFLIKSV